MEWFVYPHMFFANIVSNTYKLMTSFKIPGTNNTPWDILVYILIFTVIGFVLRMWLGVQIGAEKDAFSSSYRRFRQNGYSPSHSYNLTKHNLWSRHRK